jgi:hypothetical protein
MEMSMNQTAIPCILMRGGTSKGPFFLAHDLPADPARRDAVLLAAMGSPDVRQIDGVGGADSLTSKVARNEDFAGHQRAGRAQQGRALDARTVGSGDDVHRDGEEPGRASGMDAPAAPKSANPHSPPKLRTI